MGKVLEFLWSQWNTFTAGGSTKLSPDQYHAIQDGIHIQDVNIDALKASKLVGDVTNTRSSSGPLSNTQSVVNLNITTSGTNDLFVPDEGTVWHVNAVASSAGYTGLSYLILKILDTSNSLAVEISSQTSYNTEFNLDNPVYIGYPCKLVVQSGGTGSGGSTDISAALIRVR
jgi:hypothetical protein